MFSRNCSTGEAVDQKCSRIENLQQEDEADLAAMLRGLKQFSLFFDTAMYASGAELPHKGRN